MVWSLATAGKRDKVYRKEDEADEENNGGGG